MKKNKLGRGLDILLNSSSIVVNASSDSGEKLEELPVSLLQRGKFQPRDDIEPETLRELSQSIKSQGVIQPIIAREIATNKYEIIAGERRWRAAQLAGLTKIPVIVRSISDKVAVAIGLIENIQREDLTPIEEAKSLKKLIENFSMTHTEVADAVGRSRSAVTNIIRLLQLSPKVKKLLTNGDIQMGHGRALLALEDNEQFDTANQIINKDLSVRQAELLVKKNKNSNKEQPKTNNLVTQSYIDLIAELANQTGLNLDIKQSSNSSGKIVINYKDKNEFDRTVSKLKKIQ